MTTEPGVIRAGGCDGTPPSSSIAEIEVVVAHRIWPKVDGRGGEDTPGEIPGECRVMAAEAFKVITVTLIELRGICRECS